MANDWDLFSIVRSCKTTSLPHSSTIFETSPHIHSTFETSPHTSTNTTTNKVISPQNCTPSYFHDFNLFHENNPILFSPPITNINPSINGTNHYPAVLDFPIYVAQEQIKPNPKPTAYIEITTEHFDLAYNHPSVLHELQRERNRLPIQTPQTSFGVVPNIFSQHPKRKSWKKKNNNTKILECHLSVEKIKEDPWTWRKYGEKIIKGSSHPRSYYKCSSFNNCSARKLVEKSKHKENTYVVTYKGQHNHKEPKCNNRSVVGISRNKSSKRVLSPAKVVESSSNARGMGSPNVIMASQEVVSSSNVGNLSSSNVIMLQFDEPKSSDAQVFTRESTIPNSQTKSVGRCDDDDDNDILIPNIRAMSEDILLDFNNLNGGRLFP